MAQKIALLDGYSLMYRAYHALQTPMTAPDGTPTNAVHGFLMMLLKVVEDEEPDMLAVAFDMHAKLRRKERYEPYKANRAPMPDDLRAQDGVIRELIGHMGIPILQLEGYEADDVIGTVTRRCEEQGIDAVVVTGDRDSFQLAGARTTILYTKKGISETERVTPAWVEEKYGVTPPQMIDVKGLMGDASDNIPGVPGVGEKTALKLIGQYGSLESVLDTADTEQKGKLRERLLEHRDLAELSKELATIDRAVPLDIDFADLARGSLTGAVPRLRELNMNAALKRLNEVAAEFSPEAADAAAAAPQTELSVERLPDLEAFARRCGELAKTAKWVSVALDLDISVQTDQAQICLALGGGDLINPGVTERDALAAARPLLASGADKFLYDIKSLDFPGTFAIEEIGGAIHDVMLAAYALNPQHASFALRALCEDAGVEYLPAHPATSLHMLGVEQAKQLRADGVENIYRDIELPLSFVLRRMEREGFLTDADALRALGDSYRARIAALTEEIYAMAGERVNLNSPKQLSELLFERMQLKPTPKKTRNGYSTNAEVLESLAERYPICAKILEYRKYQKLQSTYVEALLPLRDENGRIHTSFDQVATATGRISSQEPNLQNIPVRTELGREIRGAFIARPGWLLVDADYSQIELRVLAHMSGDEIMQHAFLEGQDIHQRTAAEVYGVPLEAVTGAMRSAAKAVNFGIVYGISDFTLAKNISVSRQEARAFIERYFERYPAIKNYLDGQVALGHAQGYVTTMLGRRRYLPELKSSNYNVRAFGERCAMNSPIQGTAADIIKLAMIRVDEALRAQSLRAKLLLQVHDELIIEAPEDEVKRVRALLQSCMEGVMQLSVPLRTDISVGGDWRACK